MNIDRAQFEADKLDHRKRDEDKILELSFAVAVADNGAADMK